ncbi:MAG: UvrD-helicase domain-containing protein [Acetobacteraceae bacterium]|jgi:DNA helicase-2/ATP-dependent DNA helicase PcrA
MTDYLTPLNEEQRQAVEALDGPLLVLAGAGTGKTRVLTTRFAHILLSKKAFPNQVLAVTFTNKAAREMRERVAAILGQPAEGLWLGTFHALCARMLRRHAEHVGLSGNFTILDADDQLRLLKQVMDALRIDTKRWTPGSIMALIQRWKDRGLTPGRVGVEAADDATSVAREVYAAYQARLVALNAADFGDLILHVTEILRTQPDILAQYHRNFRYILVDEYQDTNLVQYLWLRLLAQGHRNICCVGDDDQSIYSWRGAEVENILRFEKDFEGAKIVRLESNYRSTAPILAAASTLIAHNTGRLGKTLRVGRKDADGGEKVSVVGLWDSDEEARMIGERIERFRRDGQPLSEIAVLVRAGFQTRAFEERLIVLGVPYRVVGGLRFYERQEIRDAIAYMRAMSRPADDLAFERIVNVPRRGVGESGLRAMHELARAEGLPLSRAAARLVETGGIKGRARTALEELFRGLAAWHAMLERDGHVVTVATMLDESGYTEMWKLDKSPEAPGRLENLRELVRALADFETLEGFLDHVALVMENEDDSNSDRVSLMTLHGAKGLEFDTVFLPGWEEGIFPNQRSLDESGDKGLEEERRLAYVGLTRARRHAIISHAANRRIYANWQTSIPSRFLDELPDAEVERTGSGDYRREARIAAATAFSGGMFPLVARKSRVIEAWEQPGPTARTEAVKVGARVFHQKFGYGTVKSADDDRLDIEFDKAGEKRVLDRFVEVTADP